MKGALIWLTRGLAWIGLGGVFSEMGTQIQTNTFIGNHSISVNGGVWLVVFAIGSLGWITLMLEVWRKRE